MQPTLLDQGLTLMFVGMGTVFVFLTILVVGMSLMAWIVNRLISAASDAVASDEEIAAITAAVTQHRNTRHET